MGPGALRILKLPLQIVVDAFRHFIADDGWAIASHIALSTLMAMFPFLIVVTALAGFFFGSKQLADEAAAEDRGSGNPGNPVPLIRHLRHAGPGARFLPDAPALRGLAAPAAQPPAAAPAAPKTYTTPNGPRTLEEIRDELARAGWGGGSDQDALATYTRVAAGN